MRNKRELLHHHSSVVLDEQGLPHSFGRRQLKKLVHESKIKFDTWNVGTLYGRSQEVIGIMEKRKINILCLQENKWFGEQSWECDHFKHWYTCKVGTRNDVSILIDRKWRSNVVEVKRIEDKIISVRMIVGQETINIISAYAPQVGAKAQLKKKFWEDTEGLVQSIHLVEKIFIGGDLNGHDGKEAGKYTGAHGGFGLRVLNNEGQPIINLSLAYNLKIVNTRFKKMAGTYNYL